MTKANLHIIYLGLGTNLGNKTDNLKLAIRQITRQCGEISDTSGVYKSASWGYQSRNEYNNQCIKLKTELSPEQLIDILLSIENDLGRERKSEGYADRFMDIDVLFYDDMHIQTDKLLVPHPRIEERRFVLAPMAELAPDLIHPLTGKTMKVLLDECSDEGAVIAL